MILPSRPRRLRRALSYAIATALVLVPGAHSANNDPLIIGSLANSATAVTVLATTASTGFEVVDPAFGARAVYGDASSFNGGSSVGVYGESASTGANASGVLGSVNSSATNAAGVRGSNASASCCGMGVAGFHSGRGIGVYGEAQNGFAVSGYSPNNWSGYFQGSVNVVGTLV